MKKLVVVTEYLNEKKRDAENLSAVSNIANKLIGMDRRIMVATNRTFLREGSMAVFTVCYMFNFNLIFFGIFFWNFFFLSFFSINFFF